MCEGLRRKKGGRIWPTAMFYPGHPSGSSPCFFIKKIFDIENDADPGIFFCLKSSWQFSLYVNINPLYTFKTYFSDPWIFETDPDPWIRELDYRSGSCSFRWWLSRCQQKISVFCLLPYFTSVFKDNKSLRRTYSWNKGFSTFFLLVDRKIQIRTHKNNYGSGRPENPRIRTNALRQWVTLTFECVRRVLDRVWELVTVQLQHLQLTQL